MSKLSFITAVFLFAGTLLADQFVTSGAAVTTDGDAEIYTWTTTNETGMIVVPEGGALFDILLVGGGGAGGFSRGGGGGGGGVIYQTGVFFEEGTYSITVGAGGVPDTWPASGAASYAKPASTPATDGGDSVISNATVAFRTAFGGGGGGNGIANPAARTGGSGGGAGAGYGTRADGVAGQGNSGGHGGLTANYVAGGGGGAGHSGGDAVGSKAGDGGDGLAISITGAPVLYGAGGGGGANNGTSSNSGKGGAGGGGHGGSMANGGNKEMTAGQDGVGAGGGGACGNNSDYSYCGGARGGSGVVILRTAGASAPVAKDFKSVVTGTRTVTFSGTLVGVGTNPDGSAPANSCSIYLAYGTDPDNLVSECVKSDWTTVDPVWTMTVQDLGVDYTRFYWTVAVSNDFDVAAEEEFSGSFYTIGTLTAIPLKATFTDPSVGAAISGDTQLGDAFALTDGTTTYYSDLGNGNEDKVYPVTLDAGEPKTVKLLRVFIPSSVANDHVSIRLADMELYGSNDKEAWTKLMDVNDFLVELKNNVWLESLLASSGPFRYFEIRGVKAISMSEVELLADDIGLKLELPKFLASTELECGDDHEGVTVAGKLTYSPSSETDVYGYYAAADYDADESAWAANGVKFVFDGVYKTGDTFSRKVKMDGFGERFIRLFAKADDKRTSSHRTWTVALKTKAKLVPAYYYDTWAIRPGASFYDGSTAYQNADIGIGAELIFDLRGLKSCEELSFLRFWPRTGGQTWLRARTGIIAVSYDDVDFMRSGETVVPGREVYLVTGTEGGKAITWKTVKSYLDELLPLSNQIVSGWIFLNLPADGRRPTFLRIRNFVNGNLNEAELRVVAPPPGLKVLLR